MRAKNERLPSSLSFYLSHVYLWFCVVGMGYDWKVKKTSTASRGAEHTIPLKDLVKKICLDMTHFKGFPLGWCLYQFFWCLNLGVWASTLGEESATCSQKASIVKNGVTTDNSLFPLISQITSYTCNKNNVNTSPGKNGGRKAYNNDHSEIVSQISFNF